MQHMNDRVLGSTLQAVAAAQIGYAKIYEAVQHGLGLKFKAAAGKLFYNDTYDFGDAAPKIAEPLAVELKSILAGRAATHLHIAGLIPAQAWLVENVAKVAGLRAWTQSGAALAAPARAVAAGGETSLGGATVGDAGAGAVAARNTAAIAAIGRAAATTAGCLVVRASECGECDE